MKVKVGVKITERDTSCDASGLVLRRVACIALALIAYGLPLQLRSEEAKPSPTASAKPDRVQLEAQLKKVDG